MSVRDIIEKFQNIQEAFQAFLENEENNEENYQNLEQIFKDTKIQNCKHDFRLFIHFLINVANNGYRSPNFFSKIDLILQLFKEDLKKYKNEEIFHLFKSNKRILLFLIEEKILTVDENFVKQIIKEYFSDRKYPQYFAPEIKPFVNEKWFPKYDPNDKGYYYPKENGWINEIAEKLPDNFSELRKIGENDSYICELIRNDSVEDFIIYVNQNDINCNALISPSIYETNSFLVKKQEIEDLLGKTRDYFEIKRVTLIEYAAFFGSIQIFIYLKNQGAKLTPLLWLCAIHGKNAELIQLLEDDNIELHKGCIKESIKCHYNEIVFYFLNNYQQNEDENSTEIIIRSLEYYNFTLLQEARINESLFLHLCHYDYYSLATVFITSSKIDINSKAIQNNII